MQTVLFKESGFFISNVPLIRIYLYYRVFSEFGMKEKTFRTVIANICIAAVITAVSAAAFTSAVTVVPAGAAPVYRAESGDKICLMVNVYWGDEYLPSMLDTFDRYGVKTTFFVGGSWAAKNEKTLREIYARGHEIANHGYFHKDHKNLNEKGNREEISACHNLIKSVLGEEMKYFSPPSASFSSLTLAVAEKMGYTTVMYSRDTIDWRDKDSGIIFRRATKNITGGELVLMHPTAATAAVLGDIIAEIKSKGLIPATVSEVLAEEAG